MLGLVRVEDRWPVVAVSPAVIALAAGATPDAAVAIASIGAVGLAGWATVRSPARLVLAQLLAGAAAVGAVSAAAADGGTLGAVAVALAGLGATVAAELYARREPGWLVAAAAILAGSASVAAADRLGPEWVGPAILAVTAGGAAAGGALRIGAPALVVGIAAGVAAVLPFAEAHRGVALGAVVAAAVLAAWDFARRPAADTALGCVGAALALPLVARMGAPVLPGDATGWALAGGAFVALADVLARAERTRLLAPPLAAAAHGAPLVGLALAAVGGHGGPAVWLLAATSWALCHARFRAAAALVAALVALDVAVVVALLRAGHLDPTLSVLPFAVSLGLLSHLWRTQVPAPAVHAMRWGAAGLLYAVAFGQLLLQPHDVLLVVVVCLIALGAGAALRVRAWVWSGAAFLVAVVGLQAARVGIAHQLGLGVVLSLAGLVVLGAMVAWSLRRGAQADAE